MTNKCCLTLRRRQKNVAYENTELYSWGGFRCNPLNWFIRSKFSTASGLIIYRPKFVLFFLVCTMWSLWTFVHKMCLNNMALTHRLTVIIIVAILSSCTVNSARILGLFVFPGKSHGMMTNTLIVELARRGHEVKHMSASLIF